MWLASKASVQVMGWLPPSGVKRSASMLASSATGRSLAAPGPRSTLAVGISSRKWHTVQRSLGKLK